eukprot:7038277-Pyramimonas_sp.AAC.1
MGIFPGHQEGERRQRLNSVLRVLELHSRIHPLITDFSLFRSPAFVQLKPHTNRATDSRQHWRSCCWAQLARNANPLSKIGRALGKITMFACIEKEQTL